MDRVMDLLSMLMVLAFWFGAIIFAKCLARLEATVDRMEAAMAVVADDLAESIQRADDAEGEPGTAADSALRS